jgi:hypothetical protein
MMYRLITISYIRRSLRCYARFSFLFLSVHTCRGGGHLNSSFLYSVLRSSNTIGAWFSRPLLLYCNPPNLVHELTSEATTANYLNSLITTLGQVVAITLFSLLNV